MQVPGHRRLVGLALGLTACSSFDAGTADLSGDWSLTYEIRRYEGEVLHTPLFDTCQATWTTTLTASGAARTWQGAVPEGTVLRCETPDGAERTGVIRVDRITVALVGDGVSILFPIDLLPGESPLPGMPPPVAELVSESHFEGVTVTGSRFSHRLGQTTRWEGRRQ